jgi:hypothetical protein
MPKATCRGFRLEARSSSRCRSVRASVDAPLMARVDDRAANVRFSHLAGRNSSPLSCRLMTQSRHFQAPKSGASHAIPIGSSRFDSQLEGNAPRLWLPLSATEKSASLPNKASPHNWKSDAAKVSSSLNPIEKSATLSPLTSSLTTVFSSLPSVAIIAPRLPSNGTSLPTK